MVGHYYLHYKVMSLMEKTSQKNQFQQWINVFDDNKKIDLVGN